MTVKPTSEKFLITQYLIKKNKNGIPVLREMLNDSYKSMSFICKKFRSNDDDYDNDNDGDLSLVCPCT